MIVEIKDLKVSFNTYAGKVEAVRGVSFGVENGETLAIVGESGSGKTVTAKSIMGLTQIFGGEISDESIILFEGENILEYTDEKWQAFRGSKCAMIFQDALTALNPTMKIGPQIKEVLDNHMKLDDIEANKRVIKMLENVGLPDPVSQLKRYSFELSGGQRQRAMIAMALAANPDLVIADEPTTALDVTIQAQILDLLKELQKEMHMTIILITHDLGVVADIADRVIVMYSGLVMEKGSVEDVFYNPKHPYTLSLLKSVPKIEDENKSGLYAIEGTPPDLINPPKGCPFAERCQFTMEICTEKEASMFTISEQHTCACWLYHEKSGKAALKLEDISNV